MRELPPNILRIINYIRKSREEEIQEEREGIDALERQRVQMEIVLKRYGVPFEQVKEVGSGDSISGRPIFRQVLSDIESGKYQAIAVREIQRLGRGSYGDMGVIYDLLEQNRIHIITESRIYDPRNSDDAKFIRMQLFISREEYFMIKERLVNARYFKAREEGKFMNSHPAYGYRSNIKTKKLEPFNYDEGTEEYTDEAAIVRKIFDWYVNDDIGYQAISTKLVKMGIPTSKNKKHWQGLVIRRMLENPVYNGHIYYRTTENIKDPSLKRGYRQIKRPKEEWLIHEDAHNAIIDKETFDAAQRKLQAKSNLALPVKEQFQPCELASLVVCPTCQKKMVRQYSTQHYDKKGSDETSVYHKEFLYDKECRKSYKYRDVEDQIIKLLQQVKELDTNQLESMIELTLERATSTVKNPFDDLHILEVNKKKLESRLEFIFNAYESGDYTREEFNKRKTKLTEDLEGIEVEILKIKTAEASDVKNDINIDAIRKKVSSVIDAYHTLNDKTRKNTLLRRVFEKIEVEVLEPGIGRRPAKLLVRGYFKHDFLL